MSKGSSRSLWGVMLKNFINSLKPRQFKGAHIGTDNFGNKYYEIPANPSVGKSRHTRYYEPPTKDDFQEERSPEWDSWLRGRRKLPPTEEEISRNLAIIEMKKKNAIEVDAKGGKMKPMLKGMETFPKRSEFETIPGKKG
ncbi:NADH dehydrogenase [ubiquinone] 1 alpha subcomplex assembly factor 2 [Cylas formicarius]|uniref:NADH dehydrogenase [ubiquinone] 1 alpha subcomplex assembly factor 2 n=1 Tax=Cylas formicarius TaxID=197179 RepID=UPI0029589C93|nr:NADH dehydrogenase [ubiquinone] 1 alpha subcomplex assembly factor 2 [Cylas formicarius]